MYLVRYSPLQELQTMENEVSNLLDNGWGMVSKIAESSAMDLYEQDGKLIAQVSLPQFKKDDIKVTYDDDVLEISAVHVEEQEEKTKRRYYVRESSNRYFRRVALPEGAQGEKASAEFKDGVLLVKIPMTKVIKKSAKQVAIK